jgi:unsaturated chondroitin disaccharide hydrolase
VIQFVLETDRQRLEEVMRFAQQQVRRTIEQSPDLYPMYTENGQWSQSRERWTNWCSGFFPGLMWIFRKRAEEGSAEAKFWEEQAIRYSKPLEKRKNDRESQDLGFLMFSTYYRWYRLTHDPRLNDVLIEAGRTLALRYRENGQYLSSFVSDESLFIDLMMNVGIIFYAARETGDKRLREIAFRHCETTRRVLVRGDGSSAHEGIFDSTTGEFLHQSTQQGFRGDSCWSRGLAWAIYGFSICYDYSRDPRLLATAQACADYYLTHTNADGIPPWDFNAPANRRSLLDTSAAAIAASALLRLGRLLQDPVKGHFYASSGLFILRMLSEKHIAMKDKKWDGILRGGVYHVHKELGVDESVIWGDYFFVEAVDHALRQL